MDGDQIKGTAGAQAAKRGRHGAIPGTLAGEIGPERDWFEPTGDPTGEGEGGPRAPGRCGEEVRGENGDGAGLLCSPWLLEEPEALAAEPRPASVPVGRSSMEPDRSCNRGGAGTEMSADL